jgi:methionyl-tRNA synthetase
MEAVLMVLLRVVGDLAIAVRPVVPTAIDRLLLDQMGLAAGQRLFATIEQDQWLARLLPGLHPCAAGGRVPRLELPADA